MSWGGVIFAAALAGPAAAPEEPPPRVTAIGRLHNTLGLVGELGLTSRQYGAPAGSRGRLAATTGLGGVMARLGGYADRHPAGARVVRMTLPELMLVLELGGTMARRDAVAVREGFGPGRSGVAAGGSGLANIGFGFASPGKVGVYAKIFVGQRFSARSNTELEGAYFIASAGPSFGLRVATPRRFTLLLGGGVDGVLGVQRLDRSRLVAQLAPIVDLGIYLQPRPHVYVGMVARGDLGVLGERYGGRRMHGRAAAEIVWKVEHAGPARFAALLLAYDGSRVDASPGHPQFAALGERRVGHQLLLSGGVTF
jgi:hypothetical protein